MEELLLAVVAFVLGKKTDEVAELAKSDDGKKQLTELYKAKVKDIKTESFDNGAKDREKKVKEEVENALKTTFGVTSTKTGQELFEEIKSETAKPEKLSEDAVKASPLYIALEKKVETAKTDFEKELQAKVKEIETNTKKEKTTEEFIADAFKEFEGLKPILSKDETRLANQRKIFADAVRNGYEFERLEDKTWLIKKDGKRLDDSAGNRVKFEDFIREKTLENFDIAEADERTSTGNDAGSGGQGQTTKVYKGAAPKNEAEFMALQRDKTIPAAERKEIADAYLKTTGESTTL
jgi:hypothetical protein